MLISFEVENYGSIFSRQRISFAVSSLKDTQDGIIENSGGGQLLPALLFYGANAAGKSNLLKALGAMTNTVLYSQTKGRPTGRIQSYNPFLLNEDAKQLPTVFELNFLISDVRYNYGFALRDTEVVEEWLFSYPHGAPRKLFERDGMDFSFGRNLKGQNTNIAGLTRGNSLFLSAAAQNGHEQLSQVFDFFDAIQFETSKGVSGVSVIQMTADGPPIDDKVVSFLRDIDTGIVGYRYKDKKTTEKSREFSRELADVVKTYFENVDLKLPGVDNDYKILELEHQGLGGTSKHFSLEMESAGTLRLLSALPKIFNVLKTGGLLIIDELDLSLHTQAAEALLRIFCSRKSNPKGAQLLATTHDTNLLESSCLRRDQIWFVEKDHSGSSVVYPLTDIRTRSSDNIEKGYLESRFGATPL